MSEFIDLSETDVKARDQSIKVAFIYSDSDVLSSLSHGLNSMSEIRIIDYTHADIAKIGLHLFDVVVFQGRLIDTLSDFEMVKTLRMNSRVVPIVALIDNRDPDYQREFFRCGVSSFFFDWTDAGLLYEQIRSLVEITSEARHLQSKAQLLRAL